jgi:hypothetical protein
MAPIAKHDNAIRDSLHLTQAMGNVKDADAAVSQTFYDGKQSIRF